MVRILLFGFLSISTFTFADDFQDVVIGQELNASAVACPLQLTLTQRLKVHVAYLAHLDRDPVGHALQNIVNAGQGLPIYVGNPHAWARKKVRELAHWYSVVAAFGLPRHLPPLVQTIQRPFLQKPIGVGQQEVDEVLAKINAANDWYGSLAISALLVANRHNPNLFNLLKHFPDIREYLEKNEPADVQLINLWVEENHSND